MDVVDANVDIHQDPIDATDEDAAGQADDDIVMEQDQFFHMQHTPASSCSSSTPSFFRGSTSTGSYTSLPCLCPPITPISTHYSDQTAVSLNSPEPLHEDQSNSQYPFFSSFKKPTSSHNATPHDSDSDVSASNAMRGLQSPRLVLHHANVPTMIKLPLLLPPSGSETAQPLIQQVGEKHNGRVEHDCYKRLKLESDMWARELKVRNAHDEREHAMCLAEQDHLHKHELMGHQLEHAKLELELARACREEEEARIWCIAMEQNLGQN
ncbi:hypothetical protein DFJ58DRAFT_727621 [Suillus subalutaceus]|uniref:uncharacterized protein n=1 Tax=Suillus subalutaceus TaxID=48586 RepID=UPI001B8848E2|nr:uncharacterized protein DFJ58DRAFT_727621 [Suillus subalutaceus]KAG1855182.1 hypothetical protein DFJ58DRAFT_727621 [Suillus subalutaceus]